MVSDQSAEIVLRDREARTYDEFILRSRGYWFYAERAAVLHALSLKPADVVLDAGCGTGMHTTHFAPKVQKIVAVDFSVKSLKVLEEKSSSRGLKNIECRHADLTAFSADAVFDKAFSIESIQHIPDAQGRLKAVQNIRAALKKGGRFVMVGYRWRGWLKPPKPKESVLESAGLYRFAFSTEDARQLFFDAGFRKIKIRGTMNVPRVIRKRLPSSLVFIDTFLSRFPFSAGLGKMILVIGEKE